MEFKTFSDLNSIINRKIHLIPNDIDLIVGVPRSGILPAAIIALMKNFQMVDLETFVQGRIFQSGMTKIKKGWISSVDEARKILVVEDSCNSGNSIRNAKRKIEQMNLNCKVLYMAVYCVPDSVSLLDIYLEKVDCPRMFEWNYLHHDLIFSACFDIDGVLCRDPTEEENDDGEKYMDFILNVPCRVQPTKRIGFLVTSRLEKYRDATEKWLKANNIEYGEMEMMRYATKEERLLKGDHAEFKARFYKNQRKSIIFIESSEFQAEKIAAISGKPVFCVENQRFYPGGVMYRTKESINRSWLYVILARCWRKIKRRFL